jgi:hypothetical protein
MRLLRQNKRKEEEEQSVVVGTAESNWDLLREEKEF